MLHEFYFTKLVLLSILIFTYSNASDSQFLQYQWPILQVCGAHPIELIVTWLVPDHAIKGKSQKRLKNNQGWQKNRFNKNNSHGFSVFWIRFFGAFLKRNRLCSFKKRKNILNCFYCIVQHHHFQNYTIITCYTYYGVQKWNWKRTLSLFSQFVVGQITPKW